MQLGMVGLGRMGGNMARRLLRAGHACVVHDASPRAAAALVAEGARTAATLRELVDALAPPRAVWLMLPAAVVDATLDELAPLLAPGDVAVDGGNSWYVDDLRRAQAFAARGLHYVDVGTSGGTRGLERGYCLMIGGAPEAVRRLEPVFAALAPGVGAAPRGPGRDGAPSPAEQGWLHCGGAGAGHFVKMVHNGIEYGLMAAYAEGLNLLRRADVGLAVGGAADAGSAPLRAPERFRYRFDVAEIAELWRRGSVIGSWLLDLAAAELREDPALARFEGRVGDSGEGRWTLEAAVEAGVPVPVLSAAVYQRFSSRGLSDFADRVLSALRHAFGGHAERSGRG